jgi:hypothetical protein
MVPGSGTAAIGKRFATRQKAPGKYIFKKDLTIPQKV